MASSKLLKFVLAIAIASAAGVLGSLTHAMGDSSERIEDSDASNIVNTHVDVENALRHYIGLSGQAGKQGIFVVTPEDGKLHFIELKQEANSLKKFFQRIKRLQHDACRGNGCGPRQEIQQDACRGDGCGGNGGLKNKAEPPQDGQDSKTNVSEVPGNAAG